MTTTTTTTLASRVTQFADALRARLEPHFSADTAAGGWFRPECPAAGHCAAVAAITIAEIHAAFPEEQFRGDFVSTKVNGESHWFSRIHPVAGADQDLDLTGDQFGRPVVQLGDAGTLYPETRVRQFGELNLETSKRAHVLATRSGCTRAAAMLADHIAHLEHVTATVAPASPASPASPAVRR